MTKVVSLDGEKQKREAHCEYCGEAEHKGSFQCPRIKAVEYHNDEDIIIIRLHGPVNVPSY